MKTNVVSFAQRTSKQFWRLVAKTANSIAVIALMYTVSLIVGALAFFILEDAPLGDGLWWAIVSALTVGYGDEAPATTAGRIVACLLLIFWILFLTPCLIANFVVRILHDKDKYTHEEQEWQEDSLKRIAQAVGVELLPSPRDTNHFLDQE